MPMRRKFIVALTWLVIVALPVQAMAANIMSHCGPQHGGADANHPRSADHHHADGGSHSHGPGNSETVHQAHGHVGHANAGAPDLTDFAKCSACASCCVGVALPVTSRSVVIEPPHVSPLLSPVESAPESIVSGPERPPRFSLV
jgi:hypothetical protein